MVEKHYRIVGQLSALAILRLGRGLHCFHPSIIIYMFFSKADNVGHRGSQLVDHRELMDNISQIKSGENIPLYECNIHPTQDKSKNVSLYKQYFMIISRSAGIEQFKQGLLSISSCCCCCCCCLEKNFTRTKNV